MELVGACRIPITPMLLMTIMTDIASEISNKFCIYIQVQVATVAGNGSIIALSTFGNIVVTCNRNFISDFDPDFPKNSRDELRSLRLRRAFKFERSSEIPSLKKNRSDPAGPTNERIIKSQLSIGSSQSLSTGNGRLKYRLPLA